MWGKRRRDIAQLSVQMKVATCMLAPVLLVFYCQLHKDILQGGILWISMPPTRLPLWVLYAVQMAMKVAIIVISARAAVDLHKYIILCASYIVLEAASHKCVDKHHRPAYFHQTDSGVVYWFSFHYLSNALTCIVTMLLSLTILIFSEINAIFLVQTLINCLWPPSRMFKLSDYQYSLSSSVPNSSMSKINNNIRSYNLMFRHPNS